jgi:hypothetical protein
MYNKGPHKSKGKNWLVGMGSKDIE